MPYERFANLTVTVAACCLTAASASAQQRARPHIDAGLGYNILLTDRNTLLRGVSLSWDGGDPFGSLEPVFPSQAQLNSLARDYGLNAVHLYLEADSSGNTSPVGYNADNADVLVERTANAGLYLIITIGNNGENGTIHDLEYAKDFWEFYGPRYADETHVIYEAHNEPAFFTPSQWTNSDWNNQVELYNTIRTAAPDTFTLLGSFMGFAGDPRYGANRLASLGVDWSNAGFAHHGYESKAGIENAISLMQASTSYPALLATEFFPGDTDGQGYNNMYESRLNGWMQFQWLGADDEDLHDFRSKINAAGTIWTPDDPAAIWPARGTLDIPPNGSLIGIYHRGTGRFLSAAAANGRDLKADLATYTGSQDDAFTLETVGDRFVRLRAANQRYVTTTGESDALTAGPAIPDQATLFEWIRLPNNDVALRAYDSGGHLLRHDGATDLIFPDGDNGRDKASHFVVVTTPATTPPPLIGDPFYGLPLMVPATIQAEDFDLGGPAVSYQDSDPGNNGGKYRTLEDVDIEATLDVDGGYNIGWLTTSETLDYTIEVPGSGPSDYRFTARVSSPASGVRFLVEFAGVNETGLMAAPNTNGYQNWTDVSRVITLNPGVQTMRFVNVGIAPFNLNHFAIACDNSGCQPDRNGDQITDAIDLLAYLALWFTLDNEAELDNAPGITVFDLLTYLDCWFPASTGEACP